nr:MAG TPA: hypothetical protein [Crassvirales sp.]
MPCIESSFYKNHRHLLSEGRTEQVLAICKLGRD